MFSPIRSLLLACRRSWSNIGRLRRWPPAIRLVRRVAWWLMEFFGGQSNRATERLDELAQSRQPPPRGSGKGRGKGDAMAKMLEMATPAFAKPLQPKTELEANKLKAKLSDGRLPQRSASPACSSGSNSSAWSSDSYRRRDDAAVDGHHAKDADLHDLGGAGVMFYLPDMVVGLIAQLAQEEIFLSLPDALDLMVVCVEGGLGLDQAMRKVSEEMKETRRLISEEFDLCNFQLQMGRPRPTCCTSWGAAPASTISAAWPRS